VAQRRFRGYADYMETPEFEDALGRLRELARARPTAILCAEPCRGAVTGS